ncbi:MAG: alpha/beta fold hydrolase [Solirubrobacterales bacterium]
MIAPEGVDPLAFEVTGKGPLLRGESAGRGQDVFLCHGLSATRSYVVHGSRFLPRHGFRVHTYDARGHGASEPGADGYDYQLLTDDLGRVIGDRAGDGSLVVGGHSMGSHTALTYALRSQDSLVALILISPVFIPLTDGGPDLTRWDARADALESGGPSAFGREAAEGIERAEYRETVERLATERAALHAHPAAVADALRQVPRSWPFNSMEDLARLKMPVLVIGTGDGADPGHPFEVAERYADAIPDSRLVTEEPGESPLSWQGGRLSREIATFLNG